MITETTRALVRLLKTAESNVHLSAGNLVELAKLPAIVLNGPTLQRIARRERDAAAITVVDLDEAQAIREVPPRWADLVFGVTLSCASSLAALELQEKLVRLSQAHPILTASSEGRTRQYAWRWGGYPGLIGGGGALSGVVQARGDLVVSDVEIYSGIRSVAPLIATVEVDVNTGKGSERIIEPKEGS